ncbi:uncharacterized protein TRIADDRAFT_52977 [Trichoplax adhaerens]|uniref:PXA domain-containing protein n=1 Tax=Trichoplax adhaerens TaxID=10228 RepID=B3RMZ1_TRIAD|nr:hypothetical protein TRIADDRAFT_52977 [Trichoplax adhaerens]EDV27361.1 hypothetical protein TRIADDRAFT_52977 [Trichoplax adhaerens]|eukprot:XP_002109195.1 hypothetical protein TRIADDRAFT_52977 [Trichoplax adhaerens]
MVLLNGNQIHDGLLFVAIMLLFLTFTLSIRIHLLIGLWVAGLGFYASLSCYSTYRHLTEVIMLTRKKKPRKRVDSSVCKVCDTPGCRRHRPMSTVSQLEPWINTSVTEKVDDALTEFFNLLLENYVYYWYSQFSSHEGLVNSIRESIRFIVSSLTVRAIRIDLTSVLMEKVFKASFQQLDVFVKAKQLCDGNEKDLELETLRLLGPNLHVAMRSKEKEVFYLRSLANSIVTIVIPADLENCRSLRTLFREIFCCTILHKALHTVSEPNVINTAIYSFCDPTKIDCPDDSHLPRVPILSAFQKRKTVSICHPFHTSLQKAMSEPTMLFPFQKFMQRRGVIHLVSFCRTVEDFTNRGSKVNSASNEIEDINRQALQIYAEYFAPDAPSKIPCSRGIVSEIEKLIANKKDALLYIRLANPLYRAYGYIMATLENVYLPNFYESEEFYKIKFSQKTNENKDKRISWGRKSSAHKMPASKKKSMPGLVEGSSRSSIIDDKEVEIGSHSNSHDGIGETAYGRQKSESNASELLFDQNYDISKWFIEVPEATVKSDSNGRQISAYHISVSRREESEDSNTADERAWTVRRGLMEFYVLHNKLKEFHEENLDDSLLPNRKAFSNKSWEFFESRKMFMEHYLQDLCSKPFLTSSGLLYAFLSPDERFEHMFEPDVILKKADKFFKQVPTMFKKEKGQSIDIFLQNFAHTAIEADNDSGRLSISQDTEVPEFQLAPEPEIDLCDLLQMTQAEIEAKKTEAFERFISFLPDLLPKWIGKSKYRDGVGIAFQMLQYPKLNRQLLYVLLDTLITEIFPEIEN